MPAPDNEFQIKENIPKAQEENPLEDRMESPVSVAEKTFIKRLRDPELQYYIEKSQSIAKVADAKLAQLKNSLDRKRINNPYVDHSLSYCQTEAPKRNRQPDIEYLLNIRETVERKIRKIRQEQESHTPNDLKAKEKFLKKQIEDVEKFYLDLDLYYFPETKEVIKNTIREEIEEFQLNIAAEKERLKKDKKNIELQPNVDLTHSFMSVEKFFGEIEAKKIEGELLKELQTTQLTKDEKAQENLEKKTFTQKLPYHKLILKYSNVIKQVSQSSEENISGNFGSKNISRNRKK